MCVCVYFRLIPNFNSGRAKKKTQNQIIQHVNKQIHKLLFRRKFHEKKRKD